MVLCTSPRSVRALALALLALAVITAGWPGPADAQGGVDEFTAISPYRVLDTRVGTGVASGPVGQGQTIEVDVTGLGGVPETGVSAVVMNVTSTQSTAPAFITVWPKGEDRPEASSLNTEPGQDTPNLVIAKVGDDGRVNFYNSAGSTHLVADITGYFGTSQHFVPQTPLRALDTRDGTGGTNGPVVGGQTIELGVTDALFGDGVNTGGVSAVVINVTSTQATDPAFVTVWPKGQSQPLASSLNAEPGQDTPNLVISKVGDGGAINLFVSAGSMHLVGDIVGYMTQLSAYRPITPARAIDTRDGAPVGAGETIDVTIAGVGEAPDTGIGAAVLNVTSTESTEPSFVTVHPFGEARPEASSLNTEPGQDTPNLVVSKVVDGKVSIYNNSGSTELVVDVVGWYPSVTTPKEIVLGSATGSRRDFHGDTTSLPFVRNDIEVSTSNRKIEVFNGNGPLAVGQTQWGEGFIWVDFPAHRADAIVTVNAGWKGNLVAFASLSGRSRAQVDVRIKRVSNGAVIASHEFLDEAVGTDAVQGLNELSPQGSETREIPVTLVPGESYRIELELDCQSGVGASLGATTCNFGTGDATTTGAWINSWKVTFDEGI